VYVLVSFNQPKSEVMMVRCSTCTWENGGCFGMARAFHMKNMYTTRTILGSVAINLGIWMSLRLLFPCVVHHVWTHNENKDTHVYVCVYVWN
jgi:hypothetical protein